MFQSLEKAMKNRAGNVPENVGKSARNSNTRKIRVLLRNARMSRVGLGHWECQVKCRILLGVEGKVTVAFPLEFGCLCIPPNPVKNRHSWQTLGRNNARSCMTENPASDRQPNIPGNRGSLNAIYQKRLRRVEHSPCTQNFWNIEPICNKIWTGTMFVHSSGSATCRIPVTHETRPARQNVVFYQASKIHLFYFIPSKPQE